MSIVDGVQVVGDVAGPVHQTSLPHKCAGMARVELRWCIVPRESPLENARLYIVGSMAKDLGLVC